MANADEIYSLIDRLADAGLYQRVTPEMKLQKEQTGKELDAFTKQLQERSLAERLSNKESEQALLNAYVPEVDITPALALASDWTGNKTALEAYKPPQENLVTRLANAQKLYSTDTKDIDKATLDALKERLKSFNQGSSSLPISSMFNQGQKEATDNRLLGQKLADDQKLILSSIKEYKTGSGLFKDALVQNDYGLMKRAWRGILRGALDVKGVLNDSDVTDTFQPGVATNLADLKLRIDSNEPIDENFAKGLRKLYVSVEKNFYDKVKDQQESLKELYKNRPEYDDYLRKAPKAFEAVDNSLKRNQESGSIKEKKESGLSPEKEKRRQELKAKYGK